MTLDTRPRHPDFELSDGYEWRVEPDAGPLGWHVATPEEAKGRICRYSTRLPCPFVPVAFLLRGRSSVRYFYCADHMYGRWVEGGQVMWWVVRKVDSR